jgi:hypothetical protein
MTDAAFRTRTRNVGLERRRSPRQDPSSVDIEAARIRPGCPVTVVNVSATGVLVEALRRLLPGSRLEVQLHRPDGRLLVSGSVVRCYVSHLLPASVSYRGAIKFDDELVQLNTSSEPGYVMPIAISEEKHADGEANTHGRARTDPRDTICGR